MASVFVGFNMSLVQFPRAGYKLLPIPENELIGLVWASCYRIPLGGFGCVFR